MSSKHDCTPPSLARNTFSSLHLHPLPVSHDQCNGGILHLVHLSRVSTGRSPFLGTYCFCPWNTSRRHFFSFSVSFYLASFRYHFNALVFFFLCYSANISNMHSYQMNADNIGCVLLPTMPEVFFPLNNLCMYEPQKVF